MKRDVAVQKILEKEKYHTHWRLYLPMPLTTIGGDGFAPQISDNNNTSNIGKKCFKSIRTCYSCILLTLVSKEHHPTSVLENCRGGNITSWI